MKRLVLTPKEAAELLFTSAESVNNKCHTGEIPAYRDGKNWKIPAALLEDYVVKKALKEAAARAKEAG